MLNNAEFQKVFTFVEVAHYSIKRSNFAILGSRGESDEKKA
jgi:hypothetical protein